LAAADVDARTSLPRAGAAGLPEGRRLHDGARALRRRRATRLAQADRALPLGFRAQEAELAGLHRLARNASDAEPVFYEDEMDVHLNPKIGRDWMLPGHRRYVVTPGQNRKRFVAGALNAKTKKLTWVDAPTKASDLFCKLVWKVATENRTARRIHFIVDNYIIHSSKKTQRFLAQFGGRVVLHFLPPYCPDDNRIERVWLDLHANVTRNHRCKSMEELMVHVFAFMIPVRESRSVV
jgi:hypothetical protein